MKPIIRVENLSKQYQLGAQQKPYSTLRESLTNAVRSPFKSLRGDSPKNSFWALKDINFEVNPGEVVGIIGRNGAGKSTLLKILSRITEPTTGKIELYGRVGSLLEVGTGFHPELTGRENIFLNGAILGMKREEITKKFDEIVDFAEVEQFLDTPVKHFSSGMYMRLAFAVAANLEPEVLVVDEVLAVGDAEFQKKCLRKMKSVGKSGRTILFVSHNMSAVRQICERGLVLESGSIVQYGGVNEVIDCYLARQKEPVIAEVVETESFIVSDVQVYSKNKSVIKTFDCVEICVKFTAKEDIRDPGLYIGILTLENQIVAGLDFKDFASISPVKSAQQIMLGFRIMDFPLHSGNYKLQLHLKDMAKHQIEIIPQEFPFEVVETPVYSGRRISNWHGLIGLKAQAISEFDDKQLFN